MCSFLHSSAVGSHREEWAAPRYLRVADSGSAAEREAAERAAAEAAARHAEELGRLRADVPADIGSVADSVAA